jgi:hypothetical protein
VTEKVYRKPLFRKVGDLTYWTFLKAKQRRWLIEALPGVTVERVWDERSRWMPSYRQGRWDGHYDQLTFTKASEVVLFKVTWI